jgi:hypothetical protein
MFINKTGGNQTTGQGQAEVGNPGQSQKGTERQAGSGSWQAEVSNSGQCQTSTDRQVGSGSGQGE